jgi:peptidyl-dipeptidase A
MKNLSMKVVIVTLAVAVLGCAPQTRQGILKGFITAHVAKVKPLVKEVHLAYWQAANTGNAEDYSRVSELEFQIRQIYSNPKEFAMLKSIKESGQIEDAQLARQLDVLYYGYLENQIDKKLLKRLVDLGTEIEKDFSTFRGTIGGEKVTDNQIKEILKAEMNLAKRKETWLASKQVGAVVANKLIELVKLRNQAARKVGFENYNVLSLTTAEQDVAELDRVFNELYELTKVPYTEAKADLDRVLAGKYGVEVEQLRPWHYHDPFFQETPLVYELDLDSYYADKDVKELAVEFFDGIGLPTESILARSDLYEREGKNPHAFCTDIDKEGDVRILCNLKNNEQWMETILHELGHAVYDKYHDRKVPYLLREPAHIFTTEAIAMFFGRLSRNAAWMQQVLGLSDEQRAEVETVSGKYARLKQLIFARWAMVMYNFEKALYADPDQDLNALWWRMVGKYQLVRSPEGRSQPDWAAKIHFTIAPVYYHNYVLGELLASQLHHHIVNNILALESDKDVSYVGRRKAGDYLRKNVFEAGSLYHWNDMIKRATGEELAPKYFVAQFVK